MATVQSLASELLGWLPKLPPGLAETLVNRAWRDICDSRLWSFLVEDAQVYSPALLDDGTASVTQFSDQVTLDADASAVVLPEVLNTGAPLNTRQFRVSTTGPIYNITNVNVSNPAAIVLTIALGTNAIGYTGGTDAAASFQIYKCYYEVPASDFLRWVLFWDPSSGYMLRVNKNQRDIKDPLRSQQGQPYWVANFKAGTAAGGRSPQFELWPSPTFEKGYMSVYQRRGAELEDDEPLPAAIPSGLVVWKSLATAGMWGLANQGAMPELRGVDWRYFISHGQENYDKMLPGVKKSDEETMIQTLTKRRQLIAGFMFDGNYLQAHAPWGPGGIS